MTTPETTAAKELEALRAQVADLRKENEWARASLANNGGPCAYCNLPREQWSACAHGFPGCPRGDDAMLCPHVGAGLQEDELRAQVEQYREAEKRHKAFLAQVNDQLVKIDSTIGAAIDKARKA